MFFLLNGETNSTKAKGGNRDVIERYDIHKGGKYATRVSYEVAYGIYEWFSFQESTLLHIIRWFMEWGRTRHSLKWIRLERGASCSIDGTEFFQQFVGLSKPTKSVFLSGGMFYGNPET